MTIFFHEMKQSVKSLLIWSITVGATVFVCMLMYPAMKSQMSSVNAMFANMGGLTAAFGMDKLSVGTAMGFYGMECGNILGIGGAFFAALVSIDALAKEESGHTAEFLLTHPVSRVKVVGEKLLSVAAIIICFDVIFLAFSITSFWAIGESIVWQPFWLFHLAQTVMQLEIACICFGISAFLKRGNIGMGLGLAALLYFLNIFVNISKDAEFLKYITPFTYADPANVIASNSLDGTLIAIGAGIAIVFTGIGFLKYRFKDIAA